MSNIIQGITKNGDYYSSIDALNPHVLVTGMSGSGKTVYCVSQIIQRAESGERVVVFNHHNVLDRTQMLPEYRERYEALVKVVKVRDGVPLPLFSPLYYSNGTQESDEDVVKRVCDILKGAADLTEAQYRNLKIAVKHIQENNLYEAEGIASISDQLLELDTRPAQNTLAKLTDVLDSNRIVSGDLYGGEKRIKEYDFSGVDPFEQFKLLKILCDFYLRLSMTMRFAENPITLFFDECQNLNFGAKSTMSMFIYEGRKHGLKLLLATTSITNLGKAAEGVLSQVGTRIVFAPASCEDRKKTAELLSKNNFGPLVLDLRRLELGEFIYYVVPRTARQGRKYVILRTKLPDYGIEGSD